jgi:hypothetical protein
MTNEEFCQIVEWEGWLYVLTEIKPTDLKDASVGEALFNVQESLRFLVNMLPDLELEIPDEDSELELDFGD